jgi:hypothetical protein
MPVQPEMERTSRKVIGSRTNCLGLIKYYYAAQSIYWYEGL